MRYLLDVGGRLFLVVPARSAALLEAELGVGATRRLVRGADAEIDEVLTAWSTLAQGFRETRRDPDVSEFGNLVAASSEMGASSPLSTEQVALLAKCSPRAVGYARERGELVGDRAGRSWIYQRDEAERWAQTRES